VRELDVLVRALCALDCIYLQEHPHTPKIYRSGVRYQNQPGGGREVFRSVPEILAAGSGDCDHQLAPWRAAELRIRHGIAAQPKCIQITPTLYHVYVLHPNGRAEDVSAHLGMRIPNRFVLAGKAALERRFRQRLSRDPAYAKVLRRKLNRGL